MEWHAVDKNNEKQSGRRMKNDGEEGLLEDCSVCKCVQDSLCLEVKWLHSWNKLLRLVKFSFVARTESLAPGRLVSAL